jgi:hypothetical protein
MSDGKHYVGEIGTELILDTGVLIGSAADQYILYRKPDGTTTGSFDASLFSSYSQLAGTIGTYLISHTLEAGDFDQPGTWRFHAYVSSVAGTWHGEMIKAQIFDTFQ